MFTISWSILYFVSVQARRDLHSLKLEGPLVEASIGVRQRRFTTCRSCTKVYGITQKPYKWIFLKVLKFERNFPSLFTLSRGVFLSFDSTSNSSSITEKSSKYKNAVSLLFKLLWANAAVVPGSYCYVLDKHNYIYDFTNLVGRKFEYNGKDSDLVLRFCKDVQNRSNLGYVDFGHFAPLNYFVAGNGKADFVQEYYYGDLRNCEFYGYDKMGRTAKVNVFCGNCTTGATCKDEFGCICGISYDTTNCRAIVDLALSCGEPGPRIFQGFTIGFHSRAWEVVYNGITQWGYEKPHYGFSFGTDQTKVSLYFTAVASLSQHVRKPFHKVFPEKGLEIKFSGSASNGDPPTTLSPTVLDVNWRCEKVQDTPYEVNITVPVEGYHPIEFSLGKLCEYKQTLRSDSTKGWATFGVLCCVLIVLSTASCCAGFLYKTRVEHQHGLDALPGITFLSACLEIASGANTTYRPANDISSSIVSQSTWERPVTGRVSQRGSDSKYGSV